MKNKIKEINKLPHGFEYLEFKKIQKTNNFKEIKYFVSSNTLKTDFIQVCKPFKKLVRLL